MHQRHKHNNCKCANYLIGAKHSTAKHSSAAMTVVLKDRYLNLHFINCIEDPAHSPVPSTHKDADRVIRKQSAELQSFGRRSFSYIEHLKMKGQENNHFYPTLSFTSFPFRSCPETATPLVHWAHPVHWPTEEEPASFHWLGRWGPNVLHCCWISDAEIQSRLSQTLSDSLPFTPH